MNYSSHHTAQHEQLLETGARPTKVRLLTAAAIIFPVIVPMVVTFVRRLYFHPLSKIPGPRLAAVSGLYGLYHNFIQGGGYSKQFKALHDKYSRPDNCFIDI